MSSVGFIIPANIIQFSFHTACWNSLFYDKHSNRFSKVLQSI